MPASLAAAVAAAGSRWRVEEIFQAGKGLAGFDEHQVRRFHSWARWVALAVLAHAFLSVVRAGEHAYRPMPDDLIPLACKEIQHLVRQYCCSAPSRSGPPARLVRLATPPSGTMGKQSLPPASRTPDLKITNCRLEC